MPVVVNAETDSKSEFKKPFCSTNHSTNAVAKDIVHHFNEKKKVVKGKAMLAASTKLSAAQYTDIISKLPDAPKCTCIISGLVKSPNVEISIGSQQREDIVSKHYKDKKNN